MTTSGGRRKVFSIAILALAFAQTAFGQKWALDASVGYGAMRSGLGGYATVANILMVGYGTFDGESSPLFGLTYRTQMSAINEKQEMVSTGYLAYTFGLIGTASASRTRYIDPPYGTPYYETEEDKQVVLGNSVLAGFIYPLGGSFFIDGGVGYSWGSVKLFVGSGAEMEEEMSGFCFDIGLGVKIF